MNKLKQVAALSDELATLCARKASLLQKLAESYRIREIWPEAFGTDGRAAIYMTYLGGTGTVPHVTRFWIERMEDNVKREITSEQWNYIKGENK